MSLQLQPRVQQGIALVQREQIDAQVDQALETLDTLHTAASENALGALTEMSVQALNGWLDEVIFVAQQTKVELARQQRRSAVRFPPTLTLLPKRDRAARTNGQDAEERDRRAP
ncbi:MAG: hypothetical protein SGI73_09855 [Chloroflexota bacterium]|nr:hypothetical protein [Chloroflexota bacterium]